jgi:hypothetical protein
MSRYGSLQKCLCGDRFWSPRSLVRHLAETGHERKLPKRIWDKLILDKIKEISRQGV